uniref:Ras-GEF domain-containing protein n=1 Tax=Macrostomum lignano TaxID=282301 RepID=A0A1I8J916_9PLAT
SEQQGRVIVVPAPPDNDQAADVSSGSDADIQDEADDNAGGSDSSVSETDDPLAVIVFTGAADDVTTAARLLHGIASGVKKLPSNLYHRKTVSAFLIPRIDAVYDNRYHLNDDARQQKYTELFLSVEEYDLVRNRLLKLVNMIEKHSWSDLPTEGTWSDIARLVNQTNSPRGRWRDFIMPISRELAFLGTAIFHSNRVLPWIYLCRHHLEDALKNKGSSMDTVITRLPPSEVPHKQGSRGRGATLLSPRRLCKSFILWCEKFVTPALEESASAR